MLILAVARTILHSDRHLLGWSSSEVSIIFVIVGILVGFFVLVFVRCHMKPRNR
jgi:hypothetical protein